nr:MAG TPA: hypothetical protein [Caudoviricetes sp.]
MIKHKDFEKAQELILIRDTAQNAASELNNLSNLLSGDESKEIKLMVGRMHFIASRTIGKLEAMIDWSEEE